MRKMTVLFLAAVLALAAVGCNAGYTKEKIAGRLAADKNITQIAWAPNDSMVAYIVREGTEIGQVYRWKVGDKAGTSVDTTAVAVTGFTWSPDSRYFLIHSEADGVMASRIVDAASLAEDKPVITSNSAPVWSPDSTRLAYSYDKSFYETEWSFIEILKSGEEAAAVLWRANNLKYRVDAWDQTGNIGYTETDARGQAVRKTTRDIRPSLAGVHLGDTRAEVEAVLGTDYQEVFSEETGHFPEQVYRLDYPDGNRVYIGKASEAVLEINVTAPDAATNLGVKVGDAAATALPVYREAGYREPESIHGGLLPGVFRVEGGAAMFLVFADRDSPDIRPDARIERIILTYPEMMDDSF